MYVCQPGDARKTFWGAWTSRWIHLWARECEGGLKQSGGFVIRRKGGGWQQGVNPALPGMSGVVPTTPAAGSYAFHPIASLSSNVKKYGWASFGALLLFVVVWQNVPHGLLQLAWCTGIFPPKQHVYKCQPFVSENTAEKSNCAGMCREREETGQPAAPGEVFTQTLSLRGLCAVWFPSTSPNRACSLWTCC